MLLPLRLTYKPLTLATIFAVFFIHASIAHTETPPNPKVPPSGAYRLDPDHSSITFKISHLGFSRYTGRFDKMEGTLNLNGEVPEQSALDVTVYPNSINTNNVKLEEDLRGDKWLNVLKYSRATFLTKKIERNGATTAKVSGDLTFMGVTHTMTLDASLVGFGDNIFIHKKAIGFTASGTFKRSDFALSNLLPMIGDDVALEIEAEFDKVE